MPSPRPAATPGRPSPTAAAPPIGQPVNPQPTSPQPAIHQPPAAAWSGAAPAGPAIPDADEAADGAALQLPRLLSSLPRRLQADLLGLLRRQRDYVGARRRERERALRRLHKRLCQLEETWHRLLQGGGAAVGRQHALRALQHQGAGAALHRSSSVPGVWPAVGLDDAAVPPLALEWSEPMLGGECLLGATLRPPSPASQRACPQQPAERRPSTPLLPVGGVGAAGGAHSRVPSLRGGPWSPPPATPRLPLLGETAGPWAQPGVQQPALASPATHGMLPAAGGACMPLAGQQQQQQSPASSPGGGDGSVGRPQTALERLKQAHLYSPLPSRRFSYTSGSGTDAVVQVQQEHAPPKARSLAARPLTTPAGPGPPAAAPLELRGHAIQGAAVGPAAAAIGGGAGALDALKRRRRATAVGQLAAASDSRPTTAPC